MLMHMTQVPGQDVPHASTYIAQPMTQSHDSSSSKLDCCRTPEDLLKTVEAVLKAYEAQAGSRGMVADAASLMNPEVIQTMRELQKQIRKGFM